MSECSPRGIWFRGVWLRVEGAEVSDMPEDPAVDGRPSKSSVMDFSDGELFATGTLSGHVHWQNVSRECRRGICGRTSLWPCVQRIQVGFVSSHWKTLYIDDFTSKRVAKGTFIFLPRHVRHPVLLRVYLGRFLCALSSRGMGGAVWTLVGTGWYWGCV
jgi:hypothetical protein